MTVGLDEMIRPRPDTDLEPLIALLRTVYERDGYPANWPNDPARWLAGRHTLGAWVAEDDGELTGHVALTSPDPDRAWPAWHEALGVSADRLAVVRRLFVAPHRRRTGLASRLAQRATDTAAALNRKPVLDVATENHGAIAFWRRHGWRQVGSATLPPGDEGRALRLLLLVGPDDDRADRQTG
jgi:GNAT superfamily N-acetyltransferase